MNSFFRVLVVVFVLANLILVTKAQVVNNQSELNAAIRNANPGTTITLANGSWNNLQLAINKVGTALNPITIQAETPNQVFIEGNSSVELGGNYIIFKGFVFQNASSLVDLNDRITSLITLRANGNSCNNCTVTNIKIDHYNGTDAQKTAIFKWILMYGSFNEISYSSFIGKNGRGSIINDNRSDNLEDYHKIHHNYFASRKAVGVVNNLNDQDAIRIGTSTTSMSDSFTEVYNNFFYDWEGEVEIISNKSGKNKYYNNTFNNYSGTLTLRHGNGCEVFDNFFLADYRIFSGGIRVIGEDHKIYNNYVEAINAIKPNGSSTKTTGAINISNGRPNSELNGYFQVKNLIVVNNTFVNCDYGIRVGTQVSSTLTLAPNNITLSNNIMLNTSRNAFEFITNPTASRYEGNLTQNGSWDLSNGKDNNKTVALNLLAAGTDFYRITSNSPAIDASVGAYPFLSKDLLGGNRIAAVDAGAEEFSANGVKTPYKVSDVGNTIGFLANTNPLILEQQTLKDIGVSVYPIPAKENFLNIKSLHKNIGSIKIFDVNGKLLKEKFSNSNFYRLNIQNLVKGIYSIKIDNSFGKFIVN
mgnify:FL=1